MAFDSLMMEMTARGSGGKFERSAADLRYWPDEGFGSVRTHEDLDLGDADAETVS